MTFVWCKIKSVFSAVDLSGLKLLVPVSNKGLLRKHETLEQFALF